MAGQGFQAAPDEARRAQARARIARAPVRSERPGPPRHRPPARPETRAFTVGPGGRPGSAADRGYRRAAVKPRGRGSGSRDGIEIRSPRGRSPAGFAGLKRTRAGLPSHSRAAGQKPGRQRPCRFVFEIADDPGRSRLPTGRNRQHGACGWASKRKSPTKKIFVFE